MHLLSHFPTTSILCLFALTGCCASPQDGASETAATTRDAQSAQAVAGGSDATEAPAPLPVAKPDVVLTAGPHGGFVRFSPDGARLLIAGGDIAQVWDTADWTPAGPVVRHAKFYDARFDADGKRLVSMGDGGVKLWEIETGEDLTGGTCLDSLTAADFSPDFSLVATLENSATKPARIQVRRVTTGEVLQSIDRDLWVDVVRFGPEGKSLIIVDAAGEACVRSIETGELLTLLKTESGWTKAWDSANGRIAVDGAGWMQVYKLATGKLLVDASSHYKYDTARIWLSADGLQVASETGGLHQIWDAETGERTMPKHVGTPVLDPLRTSVVVVNLSRNAGIRELRTTRRICIFDPEVFWTAAAYSPDGNMLAVTSAKRTMILFALPQVQGAERWVADEPGNVDE